MAHCPHTYLKCPECNKADQIMLEALKKIVDILYSSKSNNPQEIVDVAQAAIDAAEGVKDE